MADPIKTHISRRGVLTGAAALVVAGAEQAAAQSPLHPFDRPVGFFEDDPHALPPSSDQAPEPPEATVYAETAPDTEDDGAPAAPYDGNVPARSWVAFSPCPSGESHVVDFIGGQDLDEPRYPASLAKLMTFKLMADWVRANPSRWQRSFTVSRGASRQPASRLGVRAGSRLSVRDAALGLIVVSANDAARVIAENLDESEAAFARRMTRAARSMGMQATTFRNASGLPDPDQVTSVRDMGILVHDLMTHYATDDRFAPVFSAGSMVFRGRSYERSGAGLQGHGIQRIKSGFTRASGFHYAVQCERDDGQPATIIVMGMDSIETRDTTLIRMAEEARSGAMHPRGQLNLVTGMA